MAFIIYICIYMLYQSIFPFVHTHPPKPLILVVPSLQICSFLLLYTPPNTEESRFHMKENIKQVSYPSLPSPFPSFMLLLLSP